MFTQQSAYTSLHALLSSSMQALHQAATTALDPNAEGGGSSTIPATTLTAMQTCQVSVLAGSTTLEPTAQVQVRHPLGSA